MDYKKFLIVRLDKVGDVVLSTPVIKALRDARPDAYIAFMVEDYAGDVIKGNPYLDQVIVYHKNDEGKSLVGNLNFINKLRSFRFDAALILHPTSRSHLLVFLAGIPVRIGYNRKSPFLLTRKIPHTKQLGEKHEAEYALDMLREIGVEPKECKLHVPLHKTSEEKITYIFKQNEIKKKDVVITLHPGASCPSKRWPPQNFVKVADHLTERHKARIVIIAGPDDKATGDEVARAIAWSREVNEKVAKLTEIGLAPGLDLQERRIAIVGRLAEVEAAAEPVASRQSGNPQNVGPHERVVHDPPVPRARATTASKQHDQGRRGISRVSLFQTSACPRGRVHTTIRRAGKSDFERCGCAAMTTVWVTWVV